MSKIEWEFLASERLRIDVKLTTDHGEITKFSLNLAGLIDGEWVDLVRYDNDRGASHRHRFYPDDEDEYTDFTAVLPQTFVDHAQRDLKGRAEEYLEEYERRLGNLARRMGR